MDWLGAHVVKSSNILEVIEFGSNPHLPETKDRHDVLIKVHYTDINSALDQTKLIGAAGEKRADVPNKDLAGSGPLIPGFGGSGVVESCSSDPSLVGKNVCFFAPQAGSYASYVVTDVRCVAELPNNLDPEVGAAVPVAGLCALETLAKLGLSKDASVAISDQKDGTLQTAATGNSSSSTGTQENKSMLVLGASGGVGSWILTLVKAWHPHITVVATASKANQEWCKSLGATKVIGHDEITSALEPDTIDYAICLTDASQQIFGNLTYVLRPYGTIALLTQGKGLGSLNMTSLWNKSASVVTQSILTAPQTKYQQSTPADSLKLLVRLLTQQTIQVPLSPDLSKEGSTLSSKFKDALKPGVGLLDHIWGRKNDTRGKYVLQITAGDHLIFLDFKTGAIVPITRKEVLQRKLLTKVTEKNSHSVWKEEAKLDEKHGLVEKIAASKTLQIVKIAEKQDTDYEDGLEMQEAENVKNLWGVSLKKREKNKAGEEFMFVDARFGCVGELSRKSSLDKGIITVVPNEDAESEMIKEVVVEAAEVSPEERTELVTEVRMGLKIGLE